MRITPAAISSQKVNDSIRGKAIRRAPIIGGTTQADAARARSTEA